MRTWLYPLWVIIDLLVGLSTLALWITSPEYRTLNLGLTAFTVALGVLLIFIKWAELKLFVRTEYFRHLSYHVLNVLLVLSIVGLGNYLGNKNSVEFDLTQEKRNSLTEQTLKVLEMVKAPVRLTLFAKREEWKGVLDVLKLYQAKNRHIKLSAIDTDVRPDLVKERKVTQNGTVVLEYKEKESRFVVDDELSITNALLKALREEEIVLYTVTGHQELSCSDTSQEGLSELCARLEAQNYQVKPLDLTKTSSVPEDASAVMILGPVTGLLASEAKQVEAYLGKGGSLFLGLAPAFKANVYDNITSLATAYGLRLGKDVVVDRLSTVQGSEATIPIISKYDPGHPITASFVQRTIFPLSSSVSKVEGNDAATILAMTTPFPGSWAETDLAGVTKGKAAFEEGKDLKGPVGLLGAGELVGANATKDSRFVLLGSSSFLINAYQNQSGNSTLFLNTVSWLINDEGIISFNRPSVEGFPVILSAQHLQLVFVVAVLLVPIVFFGAAIFIYRRRRLL